MESSLNFSEFNNIVEKSQFAVQIGEHNSLKKLPNSMYALAINSTVRLIFNLNKNIVILKIVSLMPTHSIITNCL